GQARLRAPAPTTALTEVFVCIRGEAVELGPAHDTNNHLTGVVRSLAHEGPLVRVCLDAGFPLVALVGRARCAALGLRGGMPVSAGVGRECVHLAPARDGYER